MAHPIDVEHDQEGGSATVTRLRPGSAVPAPRRHAVDPAPLRPERSARDVNAAKPIWDKNNFGFWLAACVLISLLFSIVYHALA